MCKYDYFEILLSAQCNEDNYCSFWSFQEHMDTAEKRCFLMQVKLNNFRKSTRSMELQLMTAILGDLLLTSQCVSVNSCFPKTIEILNTIANKAFKITLTTHHNLVLLSVCNKSKNFQLNHQLEVKKDLGTKVLTFYQCKRNLEVS